MPSSEFTSIPIIDISALIYSSSTAEEKGKVSSEIHAACRDVGFFYIINHGVSEQVQGQLMNVSREFFDLPLEEKLKVERISGVRGFSKVNDELTSGKPDHREGIMFGEDFEEDSSMLKQGSPLDSPNLYPEQPPQFESTVKGYYAEMKGLSRTLLRGIALSLDLDEYFFDKKYGSNPNCFLGIFNYPVNNSVEEQWGVGEHTDYGIMTILKQDSLGGLFIKNRVPEWIPAVYVPNSFVINIGDMLEKLTKGLYRSTPHRVKHTANVQRISAPFFTSPSWGSTIEPLPLSDKLKEEVKLVVGDKHEARWDFANVHEYQGTYGEYYLKKSKKSFPQVETTITSYY